MRQDSKESAAESATKSAAESAAHSATKSAETWRVMPKSGHPSPSSRMKWISREVRQPHPVISSKRTQPWAREDVIISTKNSYCSKTNMQQKF
jgi:hypothetical protein